MTSLQNLQAEVREKFNAFIKEYCGTWYPHLIDSDDNDGEFFRDYLDNFATNIYSMTLQQALGKVPKDKNFKRNEKTLDAVGRQNIIGWNEANKVTRTGIQSLMPKNEV